MATVCKICAGPIKPLDHHLHCVACLGLAHAEGGAGRVRLRTLCGTCRSACSRPTAIWFAAYSGWGSLPPACRWWAPPSPGGGSAVLQCRRTQRSPHSPVSFPEDCFRPPLPISRDSYPLATRRGMRPMSISASEKEDWAGSEPDQLNSSEPSDLQEELMRVLSKAVQELELTGILQKSLSGVSSTRGTSGPHAKLTRGRRCLSSPTYTSSWWRRGLRPNRRASTLARRPCSPTWMERRPTDMCALPPSRRPLLAHLCPAARRP